MQLSRNDPDRLGEIRSTMRARLVGVTGIEPVTSSLSGTRSNQLSYTPRLSGRGRPAGRRPGRRRHGRSVQSAGTPSGVPEVEATGFEPVTPSLQSLCSSS